MFFKPFFFFQVAAAVLGIKTSILVSIVLTILRKLASCGFGVGWFFFVLLLKLYSWKLNFQVIPKKRE